MNDTKLYKFLINDILYNCFDANKFDEEQTRNNIEYFLDIIGVLPDVPYSLEMIEKARNELKEMSFKKITKLMSDEVALKEYKPLIKKHYGQYVVRTPYEASLDESCVSINELEEIFGKVIKDASEDLLTKDINDEDVVDFKDPNENILNKVKIGEAQKTIEIKAEQVDLEKIKKALEEISNESKTRLKIPKKLNLFQTLEKAKINEVISLYDNSLMSNDYLKKGKIIFEDNTYFKLIELDNDNKTSYFEYLKEEKDGKTLEKLSKITDPLLIQILEKLINNKL